METSALKRGRILRPLKELALRQLVLSRIPLKTIPKDLLDFSRGCVVCRCGRLLILEDGDVCIPCIDCPNCNQATITRIRDQYNVQTICLTCLASL